MHLKNKIMLICFGGLGDIINSTPIAKQYKEMGFIVHFLLREKHFYLLDGHKYIDHVYTIGKEYDQYGHVYLSRWFRENIRVEGRYSKILYTAPYMSKLYDGTPRSTLLDIIKNETSEIKEWTVDFIPEIFPSEKDRSVAMEFLSKMPKNKKLLLEYESFSGQSGLDFIKIERILKLAKEKSIDVIASGMYQNIFDNLDRKNNTNLFLFNGPFKSNIELYNNCHYFVGCCSGITCITSTLQCVNTVERYEYCFGPHWSSKSWTHNKLNKKIFYKFDELIEEMEKL